jgi:excisionase family DNA binding protein
MLTVAEAAEGAGTTERTVRRWIASGRLPCRRIKARVYVDIADVNRVEAETRRHGGRRRLWDKQRTMS